MNIPDASPEMYQLLARLAQHANTIVTQADGRPRADEWYFTRVGLDEWSPACDSAESALVALVAWLCECQDQAVAERDAALAELAQLRTQVGTVAATLEQLAQRPT